ncbi:MAG TPA: helix-turn-helix domain-containing protein [Candidatus Bathyarchaeia archaeon]|nr:helix-turn-helix domain-containing protein [Candidatus Bathyarchaeia archaeon]
MPVPGSLKRQQIDKNEIAQLLERHFNLPSIETLAYLRMLERSSLGVDELAETLALSKDDTRSLLQTMISRGLIIHAPGSKDAFSALHPRMTMTNIFKIYEKDLVQSLRDRRATVDRVVNLLTPIYEDRKPA